MSQRVTKMREHILDTASGLFYDQGIRSVGVDMIVARAGIAKMTLYNHFSSKNVLVSAYMEQQKEQWLHCVRGVLEQDTTSSPLQRLMNLFDGLEQRLNDPAFRGCPFVNCCAEFSNEAHPVHPVVKQYFVEFEQLMTAIVCAEKPEVAPSDAAVQGRSLVYLFMGTMLVARLTNNTDNIRHVKASARAMLVS